MIKTTFEEKIYLRALTGRLVGKALADLGLNKVAVVASRNIICSSIATATKVTFTTLSGGVTYHFLAEKGKEAEIAERVKEFAPQVAHRLASCLPRPLLQPLPYHSPHRANL